MNAGPPSPQSATLLGPPATALPQALSAQLCISTLPTGLDECVFFNSLVVRLSHSSIFCQFLLFSFLNCCCPSFGCVRRHSVSIYASILARSPVCLFVFLSQGTSVLEPSQAYCIHKAACAAQLQNVHWHKLGCDWLPPLQSSCTVQQPQAPVFTVSACSKLRQVFSRPAVWLLFWVFSLSLWSLQFLSLLFPFSWILGSPHSCSSTSF